MIKARVIEVEKPNGVKMYQAQYYNYIKFLPFIGWWVNTGKEMYNEFNARINMLTAIDKLKEQESSKKIVITETFV